MSLEVLYRKYRPKDFSEVRGQDHVVKPLESAAANKKVAHAYLFAGSRGTGKTSIARIFARALAVAPEDFYEIDGASNRGIDEVRELREAVHTLPFRSPYKVYLIDEAHMLTPQAWNALLKTLEEPPAHVIFMFATTELDKVLETVISRCQVFTLKKPPLSVLKDTVLSVAKAEGFSLEGASAELISLMGDGSFRDTLGILQKVIGASSDKKISKEEVEMVTGAPRGGLLNDVLLGIEEGDLGKALSALRTAAAQNIDFSVFTRLLLERMRALLFLRFVKGADEELEQTFAEEDFKVLSELAGKKGSRITSATLSEFLSASVQVHYAAVPELPLQLSLMKVIGEGK